MTNVLSDVRYGVRLLLKNPWVSGVAVGVVLETLNFER